MNPVTKILVISTVFLVCGFFAGRFYQHANTGYHFDLRDEKYFTSDFGPVRWEYVTDSIGTPILDPGTTRISFDHRIIYEAKRAFQDNSPYAMNITVNGNQISWDDGNYGYNLKIIDSSIYGEQDAAEQPASRPAVKNK